MIYLSGVALLCATMGVLCYAIGDAQTGMQLLSNAVTACLCIAVVKELK